MLGDSFTVIPNAGALSIWGSSETDMWLAGWDTLSHFDGSAMIESLTFQGSFAHVRGSAADDVWAQFGSQMFHFDGAVWTRVRSSPAAMGRDRLHHRGPQRRLGLERRRDLAEHRSGVVAGLGPARAYLHVGRLNLMPPA